MDDIFRQPERREPWYVKLLFAIAFFCGLRPRPVRHPKS